MYHTIAEIEASLTLNAKIDGRTLPLGLNSLKGSGIGLAWDNFDRFVDTFNGKDTLHDTVATAFQKSSEKTPPILEPNEEIGNLSQSGRRKRKGAY